MKVSELQSTHFRFGILLHHHQQQQQGKCLLAFIKKHLHN